MRQSDQERWRLLGILDEAGAQLANSERKLCEADEGIQRMGAIIAKVRGVASKMGIELSDPPTHAEAPEHMTLQEWAYHMRISYRFARTLIRQRLTEGEHYHRTGEGRQAPIVVHVQAATEAVRAARPTSGSAQIDDIAAFRAKAALKRREGIK